MSTTLSVSTSIEYEKLKSAPRLLMEATLRPVQGQRFQPTGFPDLGPARYSLPDGTQMLLVESAQSVANRMELACWDETADDLIEELRGLPYIRVRKNGENLTNSILESHRINSPYIMEDKAFLEKMKEETGSSNLGPVDYRKLARVIFKFDTNALIHGVFWEKLAGRLRLPRLLSGFIEAIGVQVAESGGVKNDRVNPRRSGEGSGASEGYGNVPFHRTEFTGREIKAYFNLDLALLRGYALEQNAEKLLIALALFKIRRFLSTGLRLRTACDLEVMGDVVVTRPESFKLPGEETLLDECKRLIVSCASHFPKPPITEVEWKPKKSETSKSEKEEAAEDTAEADNE